MPGGERGIREIKGRAKKDCAAEGGTRGMAEIIFRPLEDKTQRLSLGAGE